MQNIDQYKIECAILNSFLSIPECLELTTKPFKMESKYFINDFNKMICERIMKRLDEGLSFSLLEIKIGAWIRDVKPQYSQYWFNIICNVPLPLEIAKQYYEEIKLMEIERLANGR